MVFIDIYTFNGRQNEGQTNLLILWIFNEPFVPEVSVCQQAMWPCLNYKAWPAFEANRKNTGAITGKSKTSICIACLVSEVKYV